MSEEFPAFEMGTTLACWKKLTLPRFFFFFFANNCLFRDRYYSILGQMCHLSVVGKLDSKIWAAWLGVSVSW